MRQLARPGLGAKLGILFSVLLSCTARSDLHLSLGFLLNVPLLWFLCLILCGFAPSQSVGWPLCYSFQLCFPPDSPC